MTTREEFLSVIQNNLPDKLYINYYITEDIGFSISSHEFKITADKVYETLIEIIDGGFQFIGISLRDYLWLPCLLFCIWKSGNACACIGTQYAEKYNSDFMDFLNVKYLITDDDEVWPIEESICSFEINYRKFYIKKKKFHRTAKNNNVGICYGIMTSGTTGIPKIIQVPWSCILPNVYELISLFSVDKNDNICLLSPYTFDPFFVELFIWMITGCCLTIISPDIKMCWQTVLKILFKNQCYNYEKCKSKGSEISITCKTNKITESLVTLLQITPSLFKKWSVSDIKSYILSNDSSLRILILGGEKFPTDVLKLKSESNQTKIYNIYGITEISCWAFINSEFGNCEKISIGKPLNDILYEIDENGELYIGSNKRKCLIGNETNFEPDEVVYRRTGDFVSLKNGEIYYESRTSQLVKKFGIKVNLEKIENTFLSFNKHITECVCIFYENAMKIAIFYVNSNIQHDYLIITGAKQKILTDYKELVRNSIEVPDYVIEIKQMPVNSNGKCDKNHLLKLLIDIIDLKNVDVDVEEVFKNIWTGFVESNNFIVSGGDSVKALQILTSLQDSGIEVSENFLPMLMKDGGYENCLSCLMSNENILRPIKKRRTDIDGDKLKFSICWTFDTKKCVDASPIVCDNNGIGNAIVGSHSSMLASVEIDSGEKIWATELGGRIESGICIDQSSKFGVVGCYDTYVYCVSVCKGEIVWKYKTGGMIKSTPCLSTDEKIIYVASYDTFLYCLDYRSGILIKKLKLGDRGIFSSGTISDELKALFIATLDGTCISLDQENNTISWKILLSSPVFASAVLISYGSNNAVVFAEVVGRLHCFDAKTGTKIWHYETNAYIYSTPVFTSKHIIFGCYDNHLYCLKFSQEPILQWKSELDSPVFAKPCFFSTVDDTFIVVASTKGWIYLCKLDSGFKVARIKLDGEVFSSPKIYGDNLVLGCRDNNLYCMKILKI